MPEHAVIMSRVMRMNAVKRVRGSLLAMVGNFDMEAALGGTD